MKKSIRWMPVTLAALTLALAGNATAAVSPAEADRLGKDLTCVGAERAANADGTIPEFSGKWLGFPPGTSYELHVGHFPVDPYADEEPLFVITAANVAQYADKLNDGAKAMFAKYPDTFTMPIYPSHRDFRYPDSVCEVTKKNALEAQITHEGKGFTGFMGGTPFPIPKSGDEALMNHTYPYRAWTEVIMRELANVDPKGRIGWGRLLIKNLSLVNDPANSGKPMTGWQAYAYSETLLPQRSKGVVTISSEPTNFGEQGRLTWAYDPGTRRVRQVPEYGFDQPMSGVSGKMTIDSDRLFNGTPERYSWKLLGKREMYIPINAYKVNTPGATYDELIMPGHANPKFMRYELRRVWVVEATLKEGVRHLFGRRVLFLDEDTWMSVLSDMYDSRDQLWQTASVNYYYAPDMNAWEAGASFYYDVIGGGYIGYNLFSEQKVGPILNAGDLDPSMYTPEAARSAGH